MGTAKKCVRPAAVSRHFLSRHEQVIDKQICYMLVHGSILTSVHLILPDDILFSRCLSRATKASHELMSFFKVFYSPLALIPYTRENTHETPSTTNTTYYQLNESHYENASPKPKQMLQTKSPEDFDDRGTCVA